MEISPLPTFRVVVINSIEPADTTMCNCNVTADVETDNVKLVCDSDPLLYIYSLNGAVLNDFEGMYITITTKLAKML